MLVEARALSHMQLAEVLDESTDNTLHSDGTTKFGHKFSGYQLSTTEDSYSLCLLKPTSGSASTMLDTLQEITADIEEVSTETEPGKKKTTMSNRENAQKAYNKLLMEYRSGILPQVTEEWDNLSVKEQMSLSSMYNFFCRRQGILFLTRVVGNGMVSAVMNSCFRKLVCFWKLLGTL